MGDTSARETVDGILASFRDRHAISSILQPDRGAPIVCPECGEERFETGFEVIEQARTSYRTTDPADDVLATVVLCPSCEERFAVIRMV